MNPTSAKKITYRVLIIEDDPGWYEIMETWLKRLAERLGIVLEIDVAKDSQSAHQRMGKALFHSVTIDLRIPEKPGGPLVNDPQGINLACRQIEVMPLLWRHLFTAYAREYAIDLYKQSNARKMDDVPIWQKSSVDQKGDEHYTQKEWAQRVMAGLLPRSAALEIDLVAQRPELNERLRNHSYLGESLDFAIAAGQDYLPPGLAHSCAIIYRYLEKGAEEHQLKAFEELFFLAEAVQHWLWVEAAAWLNALTHNATIGWPEQNGKQRPTRASLEHSFEAMLDAIGRSSAESKPDCWLAHLHWRNSEKERRGELNIIDALRAVRELRNKHVHENTGLDETAWKRIAGPLRVLLDACAYLAAYPMLYQPRPAPDNQWRFTQLVSEKNPRPEREWVIGDGVIGQSERFSPDRDEASLFKLFPGRNNTLALLDLSPFAEQEMTAKDGRTFWLLMAPASTHLRDRFWEFSALDGRIRQSSLSQKRMRILRSLGLVEPEGV